MKGLKIEPDCTITTVDVDDLKSYQEVVGGYIEPVTIPGGTLYANEDGKMLGLPYNPVATVVSGLLPHGDFIVGTALVVGPIKGDHDTAITAELETAVAAAARLVQEA